MEFDLSLVFSILNYALIAVGAASLIVQGIARIAGVTPTTKDDEIVGKIQAGLVWVQKALNQVALNNVPAKPTPG